VRVTRSSLDVRVLNRVRLKGVQSLGE
jgi:hypothetical protein